MNEVTKMLAYMPLDGHEFYAKTEPDNPDSEEYSHVKVIYTGVCVEIPGHNAEIATKVTITHPGEEPDDQWIHVDVLKQMLENNAPQTFKGEALIRWQAEAKEDKDESTTESNA